MTTVVKQSEHVKEFQDETTEVEGEQVKFAKRTEEEYGMSEEEEETQEEEEEEKIKKVTFIDRLSYPTLGIKPKYKHTRWATNDEAGMTKEDIIGNSCVVVAPIPDGFEEQEIYDFFSQVAEIRRMRVQRNPTTGTIIPKAKAYIDFKHPDSAHTVVEHLNETWVNKIRIKLHMDIRPILVQEKYFNRLSQEDYIKLVARANSVRGTTFHPRFRDPLFNQAMFKMHQRRLARDEIVSLRETTKRIQAAREKAYKAKDIEYETPLVSTLQQLPEVKKNSIPPFIQYNQSVITMKLHPRQLGQPFKKQHLKRKRKRQQQKKKQQQQENMGAVEPPAQKKKIE